jgi:hypothetical protein
VFAAALLEREVEQHTNTEIRQADNRIEPWDLLVISIIGCWSGELPIYLNTGSASAGKISIPSTGIYVSVE